MKITHKHWFALTASTLGLTGLSLASSFGDEKYTYDASGNVLEKQIGDQVTRYEYTGNQLKGSTSDSTRTQYAYDSSGRLTSDSEAGKPTRNMEHQYLDKVTKVQNGNKTTEFFYNAEGQLVATNSAGTSETFAWDGLAMVNRGDELYVNEAHAVGGVPAIFGNKVAVSDMVGSTLSVGSINYSSTAYGEGLEDVFMTGKPFVAEFQGFTFLNRNYSPESIHWTTPDPSGYPDGKNNRMYGGNDPLINIDPTGLTFLHFTQASLDYRSGAGYSTEVVNGKTVGKVTMGNLTSSYAAVSNGRPQDQENGMSPNGWYTLGGASLGLGAGESDSQSEGTWTQGTMSRWSDANGDYANQTATNTIYQTLGRSQWKIAYGSNFVSGRLITGASTEFGYYQPPRTYSSLKVHPDGRNAGTNGCIGISTRADAATFIANLVTYGGQELYIAEQ